MEPAVTWVPSIATSGLAFYTGDLFPDWKGNAFVGGLGHTRPALVLEGDTVVAKEELLMDEGKRIRDVRAGPDARLLTDDTGRGAARRAWGGRIDGGSANSREPAGTMEPAVRLEDNAESRRRPTGKHRAPHGPSHQRVSLRVRAAGYCGCP